MGTDFSVYKLWNESYVELLRVIILTGVDNCFDLLLVVLLFPLKLRTNNPPPFRAA